MVLGPLLAINIGMGIFRLFLFFTVVSILATSCKKSVPQILPPPKKVKPTEIKLGPINDELDSALLFVSSPENPQKISSLCPKQVNDFLAGITNYKISCGALRVPEDHSIFNNKYLSLGYLHLSKKSDKLRPLLLIEQGGPGGSSMALASYYLQEFPDLLEYFDILAIEQRGTAWTHPQAICTNMAEPRLSRVQSGNLDNVFENSITECFLKASKQLDLSSISTYQIMSDLKFSAQLFGYNKFSFFGVSYGTLVGQYLLHYSPQSLEQVVLDSPVVPGDYWQKETFKYADNVMETTLLSFVDQQTAANKWDKNYNQTLSHFQNLVLRFSQRPIQLFYTYQEKEYPYQFDGETLLFLIRELTTTRASIPNLAYLIEAAERIDTNPEWSKNTLTQLLNFYVRFPDESANIIYQAIICREFKSDPSQYFSPFDQFELKKLLPPSMRSKILADLRSEPCFLDITPQTSSKILTDTVLSDHPILIIGGSFDLVTPPVYFARVSEKMTSAQVIVFDGLSHGVFSTKECVNQSVLSYLRNDENKFTNFCQKGLTYEF